MNNLELPVKADLNDAAHLLLAHFHRGRDGAVARVLRANSERQRDSGLTLKEARNCIAHEWQFDDWDALCRYLDGEVSSPFDNRRLFYRLMNDELDLVQESSILSSVSWTNSIGIRLVTLDGTLDLDVIINAGVNEPLEPLNVSALVYVCCSRIGSSVESMRQLRREWASKLLAAGADASAGLPESFSIRGFQTCLGGSIARARDHQLTTTLLDAGADIADGPTLYEGCAMWEAVRLRDHQSLDLLIEAKPPEWHLCHALTHCLQFHDESMVSKLLTAGADPNWDKTVYGMQGNALHEAIHCDADASLVRLLLDGGADLTAKDAGGRTPFTIATALGRDDLVDVQLKHGVEDRDVPVFERFLNACLKQNVEEIDRLTAELSDADASSYHKQLWLHEAIKRGSKDELERLLALEFDFTTIDYQGRTALHLAVETGNEHAVRCLLDKGATNEVLDFNGDTVVELAMRSSFPSRDHIVDLLARGLTTEQFNMKGARLRPEDMGAFEDAVDAIVVGDVDTLRKLLNDHPYFHVARSIRPHRCTLINYIGVNGFEGERQRSSANAVGVINLLLEKGCDPNAVCYTYRGGPGETTLGLLLSSGVVESPALKTEMTRALVRGGAWMEPGYQLFFSLLDAQDDNEVESLLPTLEIPSNEVTQAFFALASNHQMSLMQQLIDAGVDVNTANPLKQNALHWAALEGDEELVDWLLNHGADSTIREAQFGGTGAGWADAGGHEVLAGKLREIERAKAQD